MASSHLVRLPILAMLVLAATASAGPRSSGGLITASRPARRARVLGPQMMIGAWRASIDRDTGTPIALWGTHVDVPNSVADPRVAERAARQFLAQHIDALAPGGDFIVVANQLDRGVRTVGFQQVWRGLRVVDAGIGVVFAHDRLFAITSTALPGVSPDVPVARSRSQRARAEAWVGHGTIARGIGDRVVLPIVHGPGDIEYRIADIVDVAGDRERWDVFVAPDGTPIARRSTLYANTGTVEYNAGVRYASGPRHDVPADFAFVTANGSAAMTDGSGDVSWTGASPATIVTTATGSAATIVNEAGAGTTATLALSDSGAALWNVANSELDDAQVSAFVYANIAIARDRLINPAADAFYNAAPVRLEVNNPSTCNGFSDGNTVFLYQASTECENTARVADVVEHELGHVFHNHSVIAGVGSFTMDPGQNEGYADYNAANINDDSGVGRGLDYTNRPSRDIDPIGIERVFPTDLSSDAHITGEIVSGALWDLRKAFIAELGHDAGVAKAETIFAGLLERSPDMMGSYLAAQIADDDDGDLGNGVPDQCAIEAAFGTHGLVEGFTPTSIGSPTVDGVTLSVPVTVGASPDGCAQRQISSITAQWQIDGSFFNDVALAPAGDGTWTGSFPPQVDGTIIRYSLIVDYDDGSSLLLPNNPADQLYTAFVGSATPIACANMDVDPKWTASGSDEWNWGALSTAGAASGDPIAPHSGSDVLGTIVSGFLQGYYSASSQTQIAMPAVDVSSYAVVHLQYWRWLTVEDGAFDQAQILANGQSVWSNVATPSGVTDHIDREWRFQDLDVSQLVDNGSMQIAWSLTSDATTEFGGWNLDDVCLVGLVKLPKCGDGVLDPDEQCDDGNDFDGDGCSASCTLEITATGGGCATSSPGLGASAALLLLLLLAGRRRASIRRRRARRECRNTRAGRADRSRS